MTSHDGFDSSKARAFLERIDLPDAPTTRSTRSSTPDIIFDQAKQQAVLVGSGVVSFDAGVEEGFRQAASDCALLAQLFANKNNQDESDPIAWFDSYFGVLGNIGWVTQARDTATYEIKSDGVEVHQAIIEVITALLGPNVEAVKLAELTLKSLQSMTSDSPQITIFSRESQRANIGRVQFTTIRNDAQQGLLAETMAFGLSAKESVTQILLFKLHKSRATLRRSVGTMSLNRPAIETLAPTIRNKVLPFMTKFVAELDIG